MLDALLPGQTAPLIRAYRERFRGCLYNSGNEAQFEGSEQEFDRLGIPFELAVTKLEHGRWLVAHGRAVEASPLLADARETLERLRAAPWLDRVAEAGASAAVTA